MGMLVCTANILTLTWDDEVAGSLPCHAEITAKLGLNLMSWCDVQVTTGSRLQKIQKHNCKQMFVEMKEETCI